MTGVVVWVIYTELKNWAATIEAFSASINETMCQKFQIRGISAMDVAPTTRLSGTPIRM